jgi:hypothetical protein
MEAESSVNPMLRDAPTRVKNFLRQASSAGTTGVESNGGAECAGCGAQPPGVPLEKKPPPIAYKPVALASERSCKTQLCKKVGVHRDTHDGGVPPRRSRNQRTTHPHC